MDVSLYSNLYKITILLYLVGGAIALILMKWEKLCNGLTNGLLMAASAFGAVSSILKLLNHQGLLHIGSFVSPLPYLSIEIQIDNLSALFVLALSVLVFCVSLYSIGYGSHYYGKRNIGLFLFLYASFVLSMFLVFTSAQAVGFYLAWEIMSVLSFFLVVFESEQRENQRAGTLYIIMTHIGTAFLLIGFLMIYKYTQSFSLFSSSADIPPLIKNVIFVMFLIGFLTKAGAIPLHIWLPYAHPAAPSNVSALMSGVMIKTAIYGLLRFVLGYLGIQNTWWGIVILVIGMVSAVLGIAYAFMEHNTKRLLAYSSVENMGIILIGLGVSFIAFSKGNVFAGGLALAAALLHSFNHSLFKGGLFLGAGSIQYAAHTKDIEQLGGLMKRMPVTGLFVLCFSLAVAAIVPFNGFVSEWLTYQTLFASISNGQPGLNILSMLAVAALGLTSALSAACFVKFVGISFLGQPRSQQAAQAKEVPLTMQIGMGLLAIMCLIIGLFPMLALELVSQASVSLVGSSPMEQLHGGLAFAYVSLSTPISTISPLIFFAVLALMILLALGLARLMGGKYLERTYGTWDCGFEALTARMQYGATGFSKPIKIVLKILFRPTRKTILSGDSPYHPKSVEYVITAESIFEKYIYTPITERIRAFSKRTVFVVQTGSIHSYLLYIFVTVLALMVYNRLA